MATSQPVRVTYCTPRLVSAAVQEDQGAIKHFKCNKGSWDMRTVLCCVQETASVWGCLSINKCNVTTVTVTDTPWKDCALTFKVIVHPWQQHPRWHRADKNFVGLINEVLVKQLRRMSLDVPHPLSSPVRWMGAASCSGLVIHSARKEADYRIDVFLSVAVHLFVSGFVSVCSALLLFLFTLCCRAWLGVCEVYLCFSARLFSPSHCIWMIRRVSSLGDGRGPVPCTAVGSCHPVGSDRLKCPVLAAEILMSRNIRGHPETIDLSMGAG